MTAETERTYWRRYLIALMAALLLWLLLSALLGEGTGASRVDVTRHPLAQQAPPTFDIDGDVVMKLAPGVETPLDLTLENRGVSDIEVTALNVDLRSVEAPNESRRRPCSVADYTVVQAGAGFVLRLDAGTASSLRGLGLTTATWPQVGMLNRPVNQDGCKDATLTLVYSGAGTHTE